MSKPTARPWAELQYGIYAKSGSEDAVFDLKIADVSFDCNDFSHEQCEANAVHIVKCVNMHEKLVEALLFLKPRWPTEKWREFGLLLSEVLDKSEVENE